MTDLYLNWFPQLTTLLHLTRHRGCVVLKGSSSWRKICLQKLFDNNLNGFLVGQNPEQEDSPSPKLTLVPNQKLTHYLGQEIDYAVFTSETGIDANALAQTAGMIRAGGVLWLSLDHDWCHEANPASEKFLSYPFQLEHSLKGFNAFLEKQLKASAIFIEEGKELPELPVAPCLDVPHERQTFAATEDQKRIVGKVYSVAFGHRKRPLLITADRGRGKSASLGMAALEMLKQGKNHIAICASRPDQVQIAFNNAIQLAEVEGIAIEENRTGYLRFQLAAHQGEIKFYAPDDLILNPTECDLLMIDEAAHLPLPMLMKLVENYHRVVLATTEQGYEGSGRSFKLRFKSFLDQQTPDWKRAELIEPIRWNKDDRLEKTINQLLLMVPPIESGHPTSPQNIQYQAIDPKELSENHELLDQIFQLLVTAHYQTTPNDLMQLLETPNQKLWVAEAMPAQQVIGVLFALDEGGLPEPEENRRFQGHLFPQLLWTQTRQSEWLQHKTCRIVRIAVQPEHQRQKIGSQLLKTFVKNCEGTFDSVSTSFGATAELIEFWHQNQFIPLHLGIKRDKSSGTHSLASVYPISEASKTLTTESQPQFKNQFVWNLSQHFQLIDPQLLLSIFKANQYPPAFFPEGYRNNQPFEAVSYQLLQWTLGAPDKIKQLDPLLQKLWLQQVCLQMSWEQLVKETDFQSRKEIEQAFKANLETLL